VKSGVDLQNSASRKTAEISPTFTSKRDVVQNARSMKLMTNRKNFGQISASRLGFFRACKAAISIGLAFFFFFFFFSGVLLLENG
jgi:hypothetical protein